MTLQGPQYKGIDWYVKRTEAGIWCAYIDVQPFMKDYTTDYITSICQDVVVMCSQGEITYFSANGIGEAGFKTLVPEHSVLGWDYAHDFTAIMFGQRPIGAEMTLQRIEDDVKNVIDVMLLSIKHRKKNGQQNNSNQECIG